MTRQFRKREDLHMVILPGMGRLRPNQILTGDQYAKFVPHLLEEVLPAKVAVEVAPPASAPVVPELVVFNRVVETPAPAPAPVVVEEPVVEAPVVVDAPAEDAEEDGDSDLEDEADGEASASSEDSPPAGTVAVPPRRKRGRPRKGS